jgi:iron complex transport system permease protein
MATAAYPHSAVGREELAVVDRALSSSRTRSVWISLILAGAVLAAMCVSMSVGDYPIPLRDVVPAVLGSADATTVTVARDLRLPRVLTGLLVGLVFGLSGAIFQAVARNPLASPDILGIMYAASAGAVFAITARKGGFTPGQEYEGTFSLMASAAFVGALVMALAIYGLAWRQGVTPYRFVLVGIGLSFIGVAIINYLLTRADIYSAATAILWLTGSLSAVGWDVVQPLAIGLVVLAAALFALAGRLRTLQLGDDTAKGLGVRVESSRFALIIVAVALAGLGTAAAGPIAFVAFMGAPIARRLTRTPLALVPAALTGALLVTVADLAGRRLFAPDEIPVGVVTGVIGAPFLLWLLIRANKVGQGG